MDNKKRENKLREKQIKAEKNKKILKKLFTIYTLKCII